VGHKISAMVYNIINDLKKLFIDVHFIQNNLTATFKNRYFLQKIKIKLNYLNNYRKYIFKKYIYTINHKRIAINYLYFSM